MTALDQVVNHKSVHTGQNYDYTLNDLFFVELGLVTAGLFFGYGYFCAGPLPNKNPNAVLVSFREKRQ